MALAKMRSIYEALALIKKEDEDTAITYNSIKKLCSENKVNHFMSGKKIILDYDDLVRVLTNKVD